MITEQDMLLPERQRRQILQGAASVFSQDGYEGASMSRIAHCAGVSKGTLYNYFENKADLFAAWVGSQCSQRLAVVFDGAKLVGSPQAMLQRIGLGMLSMMMSDTGLTMYRVTVSEAAKFPELARVFYEAGPSRSTHFLSAWLDDEVAAGRLAIEDTTFAAEQFFALCQTRVGIKLRLGLLTELDETLARHIVDSAVHVFLRSYGVTS